MPQAVQSLLNKLAMAVADKTSPKSGTSRKDDLGMSKPFHHLLNQALNPATQSKPGKAQKPDSATKPDVEPQDNTLDSQPENTLSDSEPQGSKQNASNTLASAETSTDKDKGITEKDKNDTINPDAEQMAIATTLLATVTSPLMEQALTASLPTMASAELSPNAPDGTAATSDDATLASPSSATDISNFATSPQGIALQAALQQTTTPSQATGDGGTTTSRANLTAAGVLLSRDTNASSQDISGKTGIDKPEKGHSKKDGKKMTDALLSDTFPASNASVSALPTGEGMALPTTGNGTPSPAMPQDQSDTLPKPPSHRETMGIGSGLTLSNPPLSETMKLAHSIPVTPEHSQTPITTDGTNSTPNSVSDTNITDIEPAMASTTNAIPAGMSTEPTPTPGNGSGMDSTVSTPTDFSTQLESALQAQMPSSNSAAVPPKGMMKGISGEGKPAQSASAKDSKGNTKVADAPSSFSKLAESLSHRLGQTSEESADLMDGVQIETVDASASESLSTAPNAMDLSLSGAASAQNTVSTQPAGNTNASNTNPLPTFMSNAHNPMEQVMDGTVYSVKNGHKELIIRLNPDNLGEVRINLMSKGANEVTARLIASTPETQNLLQNQMHSLKSSLEAQGIQVDHLSVVLAGRPDTKQDFQSGSQEQTFQQSSQQQSMSQHHQHPQHGNENNLFAQMGGQGFQHQPRTGYGQPTSQSGTGLGQGGDDVSGISGNVAHEAPSPMNTAHDNGQVSILA